MNSKVLRKETKAIKKAAVAAAFLIAPLRCAALACKSFSVTDGDLISHPLSENCLLL